VERGEFEILDNKHNNITINSIDFIREKDSTYVRTHIFPDTAIQSQNVGIKIKTDNGNNNVAIREISFILSRDKEIKEMLYKLQSRL